MRIQGLDQKVTPLGCQKVRRAKNTQTQTAQSLSVKSETYEHAAPENRAELLGRIKKQINSGFYSSESVLNDITHSLAKAFDSRV